MGGDPKQHWVRLCSPGKQAGMVPNERFPYPWAEKRQKEALNRICARLQREEQRGNPPTAFWCLMEGETRGLSDMFTLKDNVAAGGGAALQ